MPKAEPPAFLAELAGAVEAELARLIDHESAMWTTNDSDLVVPFDEMRALVLAGGKRLRPAFCLLGALAAGGGPTDEVIRAGAALELLHAMALFHDDVIDASATRRGNETTHVRNARVHRDRGWSGSPERFGEGVAILVGDLAYVYADRLMEDMPLSVRQAWTQMRIEVNVGQYLDVLGSARREFTPSAAARIALLKTAKYTIERPLHIGALIANPDSSPALLDALSGYGVGLGIAFQMRDDILGVFGEPDVTGKPAGDDLRESKPTALIASAIATADDDQRRILERIGAPDLDSRDVADIRRVIVDTGALDSAEQRIVELTESACDSLAVIDMSDDVRDKFTSLAHVVAWRSA